jgi:protein TonB
METLLKQSYCDAITENRNKSFGQYELRTTYPDRLLKSSFWALGTFTSLILAGVWFSPKLQADNTTIDTQEPRTFVKVELTVLDMAKGKNEQTPKAKEVTPPPSEKADLPKTQNPLLPLEAADLSDNKLDTSTIDTKTSDVFAKNQPSETGPVGIPNSGSGVIPGGTGTGENPKSGGSGYGTEGITDFPETDPEFPGNLESFLEKSTRYPGKAVSEGIEGQVFICFIVDETGKVSKPEVIKGIGYGCDEEALRVVKSLPNWKPGKMNGHPVKVRMRVPFKFKLSTN